MPAPVDPERRTCVSFLEYIQRNVYTATNQIDRFCASTSPRERLAEIQQMVSAQSHDKYAIPIDRRLADYTECDMVEPKYWLNYLLSFIERSRLDATMGLNQIPVIGTLVSDELEVQLVKVPDCSVPLLLFNPEFFLFLERIAAIFAPISSLESDPDGSMRPPKTDIQKPADDLIEKSAQAMRDALLHYLILGTVGYLPRPESMQFGTAASGTSVGLIACWLRDAAQLFVLAHECGHIAAGHLSGADLKAAKLLPGIPAVTTVLGTWLEEYEADELGLRIQTAALGNMTGGANANILASAAGNLFLLCMDALESGKNLLLDRPLSDQLDFPGTETHPAAKRRTHRLRQWIHNNLSDDQASHDATFDICFTCDTMMDKAWKLTSPVLYSLLQKQIPTAVTHGKLVAQNYHFNT